MKHYNLDEIVPIFKECEEFFDKLIYAYRVQGIKIPPSLKSVMSKVNVQIEKIERGNDEERK